MTIAIQPIKLDYVWVARDLKEYTVWRNRKSAVLCGLHGCKMEKSGICVNLKREITTILRLTPNREFPCLNIFDFCPGEFEEVTGLHLKVGEVAKVALETRIVERSCK